MIDPSNVDLTTAAFRTSTYSTPTGECVEVADLATHRLHAVRDSKDPNGPALLVDSTAWAAFTAAAKTDNFVS